MNIWKNISDKIRKIPRWMTGVGVGILFLLLGIYREQCTDFYRKAVMICLECIGIG